MLCDVSFLALLMLYWLRALDTAGRSPNGEHFERDPLWFWAPKAALVLALWSASLWLYTTERLEKSVDPTYALTLIQPLFNSHSTLSWLHRYDAVDDMRFYPHSALIQPSFNPHIQPSHGCTGTTRWTTCAFTEPSRQ